MITRARATLLLGGLLTLLAPRLAWAAEGAHAEPFARVALHLAIILVAAKLGGEVATRLGQPAVLGELVVGALLGNLGFLGFHGLDAMKKDAALDALAQLGVLILLFEVGLDSTVREMMRVGLSSLLVAVLGVAAPFALGWAVGAVLVPEGGPYLHAFLGAALTATSVGITARVLQDLGRSQSPEARVILGAAVIDDVLGLVILAVVSGVVGAAGRGGALSGLAVTGVVVKAAAFLIGSLALGMWLSPRVLRVASRLQTRGVLLAAGLAFCFGLSWLAAVLGLAPIVGAFSAGLVLEDVHYRDFVDRGEHGLAELVQPIGGFLVPIFFVVMGLRTDLSAFADPAILGLAAALTVAAIAGKQVCAAGVLGGDVDRLSVGIGMVPRGEVGLIFANIGLTLTISGHPLLSPSLYSALVIVVVVTTTLTPPALRWSLARAGRSVAAKTGS
jgi:Kef-type K+ transport system membrane component KefB